MRAVLFGHLRLKRKGRAVRVAFAETILLAPPTRPAGDSAAPPIFTEAENAMRAALARALDARPQLRHVLRQLAYVENCVARRGWASLDSVAVDVVERAYRQLGVLCSGPKSHDLLPLETHLAALLVRRGVRDHLLNDLTPQEFLANAKPSVYDARLSDFLRVADKTPPAAT